MLLIFTHKVTHRNRYIFNLIFKDILGVEFSITTEVDEYRQYDGYKLSYTYNTPEEGSLFFCSSGLLFETGITEQTIVVSEYNNTKVFFSTLKKAALPFDVFAASFYLVSRYEEYLPHIRDEHDRFEAKSSLAFANDFLHLPLVNIYTSWIKQKISEKYPMYVFPEKKYKYISTIDVDNAYAYLEKGFMRTVAGYIKSIINLRFEEVVLRTKVILRLKKDPYDTYDYQINFLKRNKIPCIYFFLVGDYGVNDKNLSASNLNYQRLIKRLGDYAQVGIHPSYACGEKPEQLKVEVGRLSKIVLRDIVCSRQHFLKLRLPETYRYLIDIDITDDYTMGYASHIGFRASICTPFNFYDLDREIETKLKIHPFAVMEGALLYHMNIHPQKALGLITPLIDEVKKVDGTFISLWHNDSLNNLGVWRGWREVYEGMVNYALEPDR